MLRDGLSRGAYAGLGAFTSMLTFMATLQVLLRRPLGFVLFVVALTLALSIIQRYRSASKARIRGDLVRIELGGKTHYEFSLNALKSVRRYQHWTVLEFEGGREKRLSAEDDGAIVGQLTDYLQNALETRNADRARFAKAREERKKLVAKLAEEEKTLETGETDRDEKELDVDELQETFEDDGEALDEETVAPKVRVATEDDEVEAFDEAEVEAPNTSTET